MGRANQAGPKHATTGPAHARHGPSPKRAMLAWPNASCLARHGTTRLDKAAEPPSRCEEASAACDARRGMAWGSRGQAPAAQGEGGGVGWQGGGACRLRREEVAWSGREEALRCERDHEPRWAKRAYPRPSN